MKKKTHYQRLPFDLRDKDELLSRIQRNEVSEDELRRTFQEIIDRKLVISLPPQLKSICKMLVMTGICEES